MNIDLDSLGFKENEIKDRVVECIAEQVLHNKMFEQDEDGECGHETEFNQHLQEHIEKRITDTIEALAEKHLLPNVTKYIEDLCLQDSNRWGEKQGEPFTITEYIVKKAEEYMMQPVDHQGKPKGEYSSGWSSKDTRVMYLINAHLAFNIKIAMEDAVKAANSQISKGIQMAVEANLTEMVSKLKCSVQTGR